jgi:hypothetical protein
MRGSRAVLCGAALLLLLPAVLFADSPDDFLLSHQKEFGSLSRAAVVFPHTAHMSFEGVSCGTCHHPADAPAQCATCHGTPLALRQAFHALCITCHENQKKKGRVTGPRTCGECHAWKR